MDQDESLLRRAIALSRRSLTERAGGPFGAVVALGDEVVGEGWNRVLATHDPTAHAEIVAIRQACAHLGTHVLAGAVLYSSCEPCPMCLAAAHWARVGRIVWGNAAADAAAIGFDDAVFYRELLLPPDDRAMPSRRLLADEAKAVFDAWAASDGKMLY